MISLAAPEQAVMARARDLVTANRSGGRVGLAIMLGRSREDPVLYAEAFGRAVNLLDELVAIVDQLTAGDSR